MRTTLQTNQINFSPPPLTLPQTGLPGPQNLLRVSAAFPFDLAPDIITVDSDKVSITNKDFIGFDKITSVLIENISHVDVSTGLFTATLHLIDSTNERNPIEIYTHNLSIGDALKARILIQELITAKKHAINLTQNNHQKYEIATEQLKNGDQILPTAFTEIEKTSINPHYYGDSIRVLLVVAGLVMLVGLLFFHPLIFLPPNISILMILAMVILAGTMSPKYPVITIVESFMSVALFLIFENTAVYYFTRGESINFAITNQFLAVIFFIAIYLSIKTIRGSLPIRSGTDIIRTSQT